MTKHRRPTRQSKVNHSQHSQEVDYTQSKKIQTTKLIKPKNKHQCEYIDSINKNVLTFVLGPSGVSKSLLALSEGCKLINSENSPIEKIYYLRTNVGISHEQGLGFVPGPQPLHSKVLTPSGWKTHKELKKGDLVISPNGKVSPILEIYPKGIKDIYKIETSSGAITECCLDHLWKVYDTGYKNAKPYLQYTKEILENYETKKYYLPRCGILNFSNNKTLPIPSYTMGALLGDGAFSDTHIRLYNLDKELIERVSNEVKLIGCKLVTNPKREIAHTIIGNQKNKGSARFPVKATNSVTGNDLIFDDRFKAAEFFAVSNSVINNTLFRKTVIDDFSLETIPVTNKYLHPIRHSLKELGLDGINCYSKFIPDVYKQSSIENRIALLQGLMDTDGTIKKNGEASFTTTSIQLAKDVKEIVTSLGGRVNIRSRNRGETAVILGNSCNINISYEFTVSLPSEINPFYISRKAKYHSCSLVTKDYISNITKVGTSETQCILIEDESHLYITDDYIVTHNTLQEKTLMLAYPILDNLIEFMTEGSAKYLIESGTIEVLPIAMVRGRSFKNAFIIYDEAQTSSVHQLRTVLTRISEGSKMIIAGDFAQCDFQDVSLSGLKSTVAKLKDVPNVGVVEFTARDIVRHPIIGHILERL